MTVSPAPARFARILRAQETGLVAVILVLATALAFFGGNVHIRQRDPHTGEIRRVEVNRFLQRANLDNILKNCSWIAIMAIGATILIINGGIDLSIGAIYCLAAVSGAMLLRYFGPNGPAPGPPGWVIPLGVIVTIGVGLACGMLNGLMVVLLRVHPFIITLGTMSIYRGFAFVTTKAQAVTDYPPAFGDAVRATVYDLTVIPISVMLVCAALGFVFLRRTVAGREVYAIGGNETAARFSGVRVGRVRVLAFALAGLAGGIAAVLTLGVYGSADSSTGRGYELDVIAAAVVGGASLTGGRGSAAGALLGAIVIQLISNGITILDIDQRYVEIIKGAVIIIAVVLDRASATLNERRLVKA